MLPVVIIACWVLVVSLVFGLCMAAQRGDIARQREQLPRDASASSGPIERPAFGSVTRTTAGHGAAPAARARRSETGGLARIGRSAG
jgi:hypothetical protein